MTSLVRFLHIDTRAFQLLPSSIPESNYERKCATIYPSDLTLVKGYV
jgi:hypothetical protein